MKNTAKCCCDRCFHSWKQYVSDEGIVPASVTCPACGFDEFGWSEYHTDDEE